MFFLRQMICYASAFAIAFALLAGWREANSNSDVDEIMMTEMGGESIPPPPLEDAAYKFSVYQDIMTCLETENEGKPFEDWMEHEQTTYIGCQQYIAYFIKTYPNQTQDQ